MFRKPEQGSKILPENFGVLSLIKAGNSPLYLVLPVHPPMAKMVQLLEIKEDGARWVPKTVQVEDVNHMTESEARAIVATIPMDYTFTDFEISSEGFKKFRPKFNF